MKAALIEEPYRSDSGRKELEEGEADCEEDEEPRSERRQTEIAPLRT